ncbi:hypothetical protein EYF80_031845 [Liparis tanakae]|uniref:Uncharacterized protein n=1 Tax=Liparis tanakae TaxID=230148 RepID=A0A4Z2GWV4_9TELE|nr:hypothetical protein EYF80_031845 [Liparis tanakae]
MWNNNDPDETGKRWNIVNRDMRRPGRPKHELRTEDRGSSEEGQRSEVSTELDLNGAGTVRTTEVVPGRR